MPELITSATIEMSARELANTLISHTAAFNKLDAAGGDGDMGTTLASISRALLADTDVFPADIAHSFLRLVKIISKTSGSSLSAVIMTGLMAMAKQTSGQTELGWQEFSALIGEAIGVMQTRSKARLGDKTILDGLAAIAEATSSCKDGVEFATKASAAATNALKSFHERPALIGRLRLETGKGIGHDDPGMVALEVCVNTLASNQDGFGGP